MGLLDKFNKGETALSYVGDKPSSISSSKDSNLHFTYSINGIPPLRDRNRPRPSRLDLNGETPPTYSETGPSDGRYGRSK